MSKVSTGSWTTVASEGSGDVDAAGGEDGAVPVVDFDVVQVGRFSAGYEDARAVLGFDGGDAVGIEAAADEADLFSWDGQFGCRQHQVVFDQEVEFGVDFLEAGDDGFGKAEELVLLAPGEVGDADVAHTQLFPHLDADGADVTDDASDGQIAQNGDFRGDGGIPSGHEINQLVLETRDVDLQTVVLVDEADFGEDVPVGHAIAEAHEVNAGEAVLIGTAREINQMIGCFQKFLDDRQAAGHMPKAVGRCVKCKIVVVHGAPLKKLKLFNFSNELFVCIRCNFVQTYLYA